MVDRTILVVDDEPLIREVYRRTFVQAGYAVDSVETAEAALDRIRETPVWVFFVDLNLAGMSGVDLCRQIRERSPMAILHAVTGYASLFDVNDCRAAGFDDYFVKPVSLSELVHAAEIAFARLDRWNMDPGSA